MGRWKGTDPNMPQPPLNHHVLVLHLGGEKQVRRLGDGLRKVVSVPNGGITLIPAGHGFDWLTHGPIDFAHLYIHPNRLDRTVSTVFDRDPTSLELHDVIGADDPLLRELATAIMTGLGVGQAPRAYLETLFDTALAELIQRYSNVGKVRDGARYAIPPARLRRVLEHIEATLSSVITLHGLAEVAGLSPFHFGRIFHQAVGEPPLAYVVRRRIEKAASLLRATEQPIANIASQVGFSSSAHFSTTFRRHMGMSPRGYRGDVACEGAATPK